MMERTEYYRKRLCPAPMAVGIFLVLLSKRCIREFFTSEDEMTNGLYFRMKSQVLWRLMTEEGTGGQERLD